VISEVYGGGGNTGATYTNDFIELYNPTSSAISVEGKSVQYRSATGTGAPSGTTALSGSVPAGGHYLIQEAAGTGGTTALPTPDAIGTIAMGGTGGQAWLADTTAALTPPLGNVNQSNIIDFVGAATTAASYETAKLSANPSNTTSAARNATGTDTDNNATDFTVGALSPENAGSVPPPPPENVTATIAEIQGTGATSPLAGKVATTSGVVTAAYPTGGLNGFYLQTPGAGNADASDAIFVYGGSSGFATYPQIGDHLEVTGQVSEFAGSTQLTSSSDKITSLAATAAPAPLAIALPATEADREVHEGELLAPTGAFTVTNTFSTNQYAEIGLAAGSKPLIQPTDVVDAQDKAAVDAVTADNAARAITLDDGASVNFLSAANQGTALPWLTKANPVRVGAPASFHAPVVLEFRNNVWKFQPTTRVTDDGAATASFVNTRTPAPENVGGNLRLATFNVLNYFNTTGKAFVSAGGSCTFYNDRTGTNPVTDNTCTPDGPRGAAEAEDLERQQAKIVAAINKLGANIVSLEEIENSVKLLGETDRDDALSDLVDALNTAAGSNVWAYAPSPAAADLPALAEQDVIRSAFIYKPAAVDLVGASKVLVGSAAFASAREPLAQAFKPAGAPASSTFAVIVNHFKSKGSGTPDPDGQGNSNVDRVAQAHDLQAFADSFAADRGTDKVFLTGDFNSYTEEDPLQVLYGAGYTNLESDTAGESTYSFSGLSGSLDHVLANDAALAMVTGVDIWNINSGESVAFEYSRHNYNVTDFYSPDPYRASDHDPEVVGLDVATAAVPVELNILGLNDFHGRINANTVKWAGTVEQLTEGKEDNTLLVGAGDLIGASEFASSVQQDQPTIDVLNALGLDASAVGNHEFDQGFADLRDRVIGADGSRNATWDYLGANVYAKGTTDPVLPEYASFDIDGVDIAVVGAVTEETKTLVSPAGIADLTFGNPVTAVNRVAGELSDGDTANGEADVIIAAFHAGATQGVGSNYAAEVAKGGEFAQMADLDDSVDVIFNGHTHQVYAWDAPVPGQAGKSRPIVQTGEYASNVGQVTLTVDPATGDVSSYAAKNVARTSVADADLVAKYPRVAKVKQIVDAATAYAAKIGNEPVGSVTADITRARTATGGEDRGAESTVGDLVANALRDGLPSDIGSADLGIVNPGGLRDDLKYAAGDTVANPANTAGVVTYSEANAVLPFVNNVSLVRLTGAQLKSVLEEQWQPDGSSRPFLALGLSDNVRVTQDATKARGSRITSVIINGQPLDVAKTYTVSTFSFLATGGDNFTSFKQGTSRDTGLVDRDLWIGYLKGHTGIAPDFARQQVAESGLPQVVNAGDAVSFTLSKLDLTSAGSPANTSVTVYLRSAGESRKVGVFPVTGGTANVAFTAPENLAGPSTVVVVADPTLTQVGLPLTAAGTDLAATAEDMTYGTDGSVTATVTSEREVTGDVQVLDGDTVLGTGTLSGGTATVTIPGTALEVGSHTLTVRYLGDAQNAPSSATVELDVAKAAATVSATAARFVYGRAGTVKVSVDPTLATGAVRVLEGENLLGESTLTDGATTVTIPARTLKPGAHDLTVVYAGDQHVREASAPLTVQVGKATPKMTVTSSPRRIERRETRPVFTVQLDGVGFPVTGRVTVTRGGESWTERLDDGTATIRTARVRFAGQRTYSVTYAGNGTTESVTRKATITVVR
jgi:5'-nucleotidase